LILEIEREWAKYPGWFSTLEADVQEDLIAYWMVKHVEEK